MRLETGGNEQYYTGVVVVSKVGSGVGKEGMLSFFIIRWLIWCTREDSSGTCGACDDIATGNHTPHKFFFSRKSVYSF